MRAIVARKVAMATAIVAVAFGSSPRFARAQYANGYYGGGAKQFASLKSCIEQNCGSPASVTSVADGYNKRSAQLERIRDKKSNLSLYPSNIQAAIYAINAKKDELNKVTLAALEHIDENGEARLEGAGKRIYNYISSMKHKMSIRYERNIYGDPIRVDIEKTKAALKDVDASEREWLIQVAQEGIAAEQRFGESALNSQPTSVMLKQMFRGSTVEEALGRLKTQISGELKETEGVSQIETALYFANLNKSVLEDLLKKDLKHLTENEIRELLRWDARFARTRAMVSADMKALESREAPKMKDLLAEIGGKDKLIERYRRLVAKSDRTNSVKNKDCEAVYFMNTGILPNEAQQARLRSDIDRTKANAKAVVEKQIPAALQQPILSAIDRTEFVLPPTSGQFREAFANGFSRDLDSNRAAALQIKRAKASDVQSIMLGMLGSPSMKAYLDQPDETEEQIRKQPNPRCGAYSIKPGTDKHTTLLGAVILSYSTAQYSQNSREFTIAHELGHAVSAAIDVDPVLTAAMKDVRACLAGVHTEPMPPEAQAKMVEAQKHGFELFGHYVEEDFADSIASAATKNSPGKNPWCAFIEKSGDQFFAFNMQSEGDDEHSSNLWRLMAVDFLRNGKLRLACRDYLEPFGMVPKFENCLSKVKMPTTSPTLAPTVKTQATKK